MISRKELRLRVAKEVLRLLRAKLFEPSYQAYFEIDTKSTYMRKLPEEFSVLKGLALLGTIPKDAGWDGHLPCRVCAIGSLLLGYVSATRASHGVTIEKGMKHSGSYQMASITEGEIRRELVRVFTPHQLDLFEGLFMGGLQYMESIDGSSEAYANVRLIIASPFQKLTLSERLEALMRVVIDQEGDFAPFKHPAFKRYLDV